MQVRYQLRHIPIFCYVPQRGNMNILHTPQRATQIEDGSNSKNFPKTLGAPSRPVQGLRSTANTAKRRARVPACTPHAGRRTRPSLKHYRTRTAKTLRAERQPEGLSLVLRRDDARGLFLGLSLDIEGSLVLNTQLDARGLSPQAIQGVELAVLLVLNVNHDIAEV